MTLSPSLSLKLSPRDRLVRAKVQMYPRCPATAYLLLRMKLLERADVPTMGVDMAGNLYWNPAWVSTLTEEQLVGGLRHEVWHIAKGDFERTGLRNRHVANVCQDLVVNAMCHQDGFELPPHGRIPDRNDTYTFTFPPGSKVATHTVEHISTRAWEDIYAELWPLWPKVWLKGDGDGQGGKKGRGPAGTGTTLGRAPSGKTGKKGEPGTADGGPPGGFDQHDYSQNSRTPEERESREQERRERVAEAAQIAKSAGKLPANLERFIDQLLESKLPWRQLLQKLVQSHVPVDFSWKKPARRGISADLYLPSTKKETVRFLAAFDTSGSIGSEERAEMASEIYAALHSYPSVEVEVVLCDVEVHSVEKLTSDTADRIKAMAFPGGGGTSHKKVLKWVEDHRPDTKLLICFTDGYSDINDCPPPPCPVLWVISKTGVQPEDIAWGEVMKLD